MMASLTRTPSPMTTFGPIATLGPIFALGSIWAVGWMKTGERIWLGLGGAKRSGCVLVNRER